MKKSIQFERSLAGLVLLDPAGTMLAIKKAGGFSVDIQDTDAAAVFRAVASEKAEGHPLTPEAIFTACGLPGSRQDALTDNAPLPSDVWGLVREIREADKIRQAVSILETDNGDLAWKHSELGRLLLPVTVDGAGDAMRDCLSLADLAGQEIDAGEILIGDSTCRYQERGAVLLLSAGAGTGKSHVSAQCAVNFAQGFPAFGLPPVRALRCLTLQAENPPNDSRAIAANMLRGLPSGAVALVHENTRQLWLPGCTGDAFLARLANVLRRWSADMVFIDPLLAFSPGDLTRPDVVQSFCRQGLGKLAVDFGVGLFICHHTPKPNQNRDTSKMGAYDHQYMASGNADIAANWPRCALGLQPLARGEFLLRATKRRPPWKNANGEQAWEIGIRHTDAGIWETFEADAESVRTGRPPAPGIATFHDKGREIAAKVCPCSLSTLADRFWHDVTGAKNRGRELVDSLVNAGILSAVKGQGRGAPVTVTLTEK